jgi:hypothetical protein
MHVRTFYIIVFLLSNLLVYSQKNSIDNIRLAVEQINKDSGYSKKVLDGEAFLEEAPDGGAELTGYFKNGELVKIMEWIGLSSCIRITEYYLQSHHLIFTYTQEKDFAYSESLKTFDPQKQILKMECRFYFENDKMIKNIFKGESRCSGKPEVEWSKTYLQECYKYQKLLKNK